MMDNAACEARRWLGLGDPPGGVGPPIPVRPAVVDAVTADDLGPVPLDLSRIPEWERISDHDREEVLRFRRFMGVLGRQDEP